VSEFASRPVVEDDALLAKLVDQARKFLFGRDLPPILDRRLKAIRVAAQDTTRDARPLRDLQPVLERVTDALGAYRVNLNQEMDIGAAPGRLSNVYGSPARA
jgi:hypothetical protein